MAAGPWNACLPAHPLLKLVSGPAAIQADRPRTAEAAGCWLFGALQQFLDAHSFWGLRPQPPRPAPACWGAAAPWVSALAVRANLLGIAEPQRFGVFRAVSWDVVVCAEGKPGSGAGPPVIVERLLHARRSKRAERDLPEDEPREWLLRATRFQLRATPQTLLCATDWLIQADEEISNSRLLLGQGRYCSPLSTSAIRSLPPNQEALP